LDVAIEAGANSINGVTFQIEDPSSVESDARQSAVEDARAKAEELASLTDVGIGNVVSISEVVGGNGGYYQSNFESAAFDTGAGGGFAPGELNLVMRLQIAYAILPASEGESTVEAPNTPQINEAVTVFVAPELADCVGVGPQKCMQVKFNSEEEWTFFYDQIEGFTYEEGFSYELLVTVSEVENPPADGSSLRYTLVDVVSKIEADAEAATSDLDGTKWVVTGIQEEGAMTSNEIDETITASFEGGNMFGVSGCNNYSTTYSADSGSLELGVAATTMMACPDEIMQRERTFLLALESITSYTMDGDTLELLDADGIVQLAFEKIDLE
jgi:heat shock protein HslJ